MRGPSRGLSQRPSPPPGHRGGKKRAEKDQRGSASASRIGTPGKRPWLGRRLWGSGVGMGTRGLRDLPRGRPLFAVFHRTHYP